MTRVDTPKKVRAMRSALGMTQRQFALEIGLSEQSVRHIESGHNKMSKPLIMLLGYYARYGRLEDAK